MAYNINKSNSDPVTVPTGAIDNQFDIPLIGQDAINYGDDLALAFVRLLENFANNSAPAFGSARTTGQLWYDTTGSGSLKIYNGTQFVAIPKTSEVVLNTGNENISGTKTFNGRPAFNGGTSGVDSPFTVDSTFAVTNLNADLLDGEEGSFYAPVSSVIGKKTLYVPAREMYSTRQSDNTITTGAQGANPTNADLSANLVPATVALTPGRPLLSVWNFDDTTEEEVQFNVAFPKEWDEGTVTFQVFWTANSVATDEVIWGLEAVATGATEDIDVAFGAAVTVTSSNVSPIYTLNVAAESAALTVGGSPDEDHMTFFRLYRDATDGADNLAGDAQLIGVKIFFTTDAATSA